MKFIVRSVIIVLCGFILLSGIYFIMERKYKQSVGIDSYSKEFKLVPLTDENELLHTVAIVAANAETKVLYSVPRCFSSRWAFYTGWANEKNDFFVCSGDIGVYLYMYNDNDEDWSEFYVEKVEHGDIEEYFIRYSGNECVEFDIEEQIYSAEYIPENVKSFIRKK